MQGRKRQRHSKTEEQRQRLETDTPHTTVTVHVRGQESARVGESVRRAGEHRKPERKLPGEGVRPRPPQLLHPPQPEL